MYSAAHNLAEVVVMKPQPPIFRPKNLLVTAVSSCHAIWFPGDQLQSCVACDACDAVLREFFYMDSAPKGYFMVQGSRCGGAAMNVSRTATASI
jgi:hypothetical protein